jgi:hypothetical protein
MALASTMTGLPPVRMRYPSLGTPIIKFDPKFKDRDYLKISKEKMKKMWEGL